MSKSKFPHKYIGPTLAPRAGGAGIASGTAGRILGVGPREALAGADEGRPMVEFLPHWGEGWLSLYLPADEVITR